MSKRMLIDASHPEETRVVIVRARRSNIGVCSMPGNASIIVRPMRALRVV